MRQKSGPVKEPAEKVVKDIRRATRRQFAAEEKIRIVLEGLRGPRRASPNCAGARESSRTCITAGRRISSRPGRSGSAFDTARAATSDEVKDLRREASALKEVVAELTLENRLLKKNMIADGEGEA